LFIHNLNQSLSSKGSPIEASLGLELLVPEFLGEKEAFGPEGKAVGTYADFAEETRLMATLLLEVVTEEGGRKPIFNPSLIVKIRPEAIKSKECEDLLFKSHELAAENGTPLFANLCPQNQKYASYTATGCRFGADWTEDWELDTLRTGSVDDVIINLPRLSYDGGNSQTRFLELLDDRLEMALRALEIKHQTINQHLREGLLPFLAQRINGDPYFRLENATHLISFVGLNETVKSLSGKYVYEDEGALNLAQELIASLLRAVQKYMKPKTRVYLSMTSSPEAAERLAELDVERYGWAQVHVQGTREKPFYTDAFVSPLEAPISWKERINIEGKFHKLTPGGHLAVIQLANEEMDSNKLLSATKYGLENHNLGLYTYGRNLTHCNRCQKTFFGILSKCPLCGSVNTLVCFSRVSGRYSPISQWTMAKRFLLEKRMAYTLNSD
ncbi:MAG: anaerobic ribonucleoside-triphosphate reductase, partial [Candidatus Bathyarchaeia archaeon]